MNVQSLSIPEVILIEPKVYADDRGFFFESFNQQKFEKLTGISASFVQDNQSKSERGVLRGLHYQMPPKAQGKLIRVIQGEIFDVAVDIRKSSPNFGQWVGEILSGENKKQLWIPEGFAHGFVTISETAEVLYKATDYYAPELERSIIWNDEDIDIQWPLKDPNLSHKDMMAVSFKEAEHFL